MFSPTTDPGLSVLIPLPSELARTIDVLQLEQERQVDTES